MSNVVISKNNIKRLLKDVAEVIKNPLNKEGIYYVHDESDMFKGYAMIIGPEGTPMRVDIIFLNLILHMNILISLPV